MIFRSLDSNGDWTFGKGISSYAKDNNAILQNIGTQIKSWVGDCFFAPSEGIDWNGRIDVGEQKNLEYELRALILQSYGVVGLSDVSVVFDGSTRLFGVTFTIDTIYGENFQAVLSQFLGE
jgi:hypothetical protein